MTELSELKETMNQIKETLDYILKAENIYIERELRLNYIRDEIRHLKENVECTDDAYEKGLRTGLSISESILSITIPVSMAFARTVAVDIGEWEKKNQEASSQAPEEEPK
ncbi:MAG: hypothetical protein KAS32_05060 [Candidatus Peribacteraceae bacterium]|nr:hypothetical protein [Candidatus Peribacteraceae bacterium]